MPTDPLVYVIIVNYNGINYLKNCLSSLMRQTYHNYRVVVYDNASTDGSREFIKTTFPTVTLISNAINIGFARGNNNALKFALQQKADYVFLINNDTESEEQLVKKLVAAFKTDPTIGIASPTVFDLKNKEAIQEMGMAADKFAYPQPIKTQTDAPIFFVSGCSMMIKADLLRQVGVFDERYFMFVEDLDLCWRARLAGYRTIVASNAKIYHASGASLVGGVIKCSTYSTNIRRVFFREKNTLRTLIKNYSLKNLFTIVPFYACLLMVESLFWLSILKPAVSKELLKALLWNLSFLPETFQERLKVQSLRKVTDREITNTMAKGYGKLGVFRTVGVPKFTS